MSEITNDVLDSLKFNISHLSKSYTEARVPIEDLKSLVMEIDRLSGSLKDADDTILRLNARLNEGSPAEQEQDPNRDLEIRCTAREEFAKLAAHRTGPWLIELANAENSMDRLINGVE